MNEKVLSVTCEPWKLVKAPAMDFASIICMDLSCWERFSSMIIRVRLSKTFGLPIDMPLRFHFPASAGVGVAAFAARGVAACAAGTWASPDIRCCARAGIASLIDCRAPHNKSARKHPFMRHIVAY